MKLNSNFKWLLVTGLTLMLGLWLMRPPANVGAQEPTGGDIEIQAALGTVFTYQGRLQDGGNPANGTYDFEFRLFDAATGGIQYGNAITIGDVAVNNGFFTVELNFGGSAFTGDARWLQIGVRPGASTGAYTLLSPRQPLNAVPYALGLRPGAGIMTTGFTGLAIQNNSTSSNARGLVVSSASGTGIIAQSSGTGTTLSVQNNGAGPLIQAFGNNGGGAEFQIGNNGDVFVAGNQSFGAATRQMLNLWDTVYGIGVQNYTLYYRSDNGFAWYQRGTHSNTQNDPGSGGKRLMTLDSNGRLAVNSLQISGGSDLSEQFDIQSKQASLKPSPGMVVSIDPEHPGQLAVSSRAYDRTVAGIVSGAGGVNTGMVMGQSGSTADGQYPVALTGRVYVWADASSGPIQPGDLLTTSDTPGHAMKVADYERAQGAIIGKAMSGLEKGKGLVLVLVSLQ
jgi:hypothetical protein